MLIVDDDAASRRLLDVRLRRSVARFRRRAMGQQALSEIPRRSQRCYCWITKCPGWVAWMCFRAAEGRSRSSGDRDYRHGSIESAVEAMKEGAYDFITKPIDANHFEIVVRKALESEGLKRGLELFSEETDKRHRLIIGKSEKMKEAVEIARKLLRARPRCCSWEKAAPAKKFLRGRFTIGAKGKTNPLSRSTA